MAQLIQIKKIDYVIAGAGQEIDLGNGIKMEVLNPPESLWKRPATMWITTAWC